MHLLINVFASSSLIYLALFSCALVFFRMVTLGGLLLFSWHGSCVRDGLCVLLLCSYVGVAGVMRPNDFIDMRVCD